MTKYYWYMATAPQQLMLADIAVGNYKGTVYGYTSRPDMEEIERNDLRFLSYCTVDEILGRSKVGN